MVVLVDEIGEKGLELERELTMGYLTDVLCGEGLATGFRPLAPSTLTAAFEKISDKLLLEARSSVHVAGTCKRCTAELEIDVPVHFQLSLVSRPSSEEASPSEPGHAKSQDEDGRGASFKFESVDEERFDGRKIDLGRIVREQILLALPMDVLCKESCKGLCTVCGQDLNVSECGCERRATDPRWAALKDIKLD